MHRRSFVIAMGAAAVAGAGEAPMRQIEPDWAFVADTVMGGVSTGRVTRGAVAGREAARLTGRVSLENDGGFVQMATPMPSAAGWAGIEIDLTGNGERYDIRLRTADLARPWQSYRAEVVAPRAWTTLRLSFGAFAPNRTEVPFDPARLRRLGIVAVGRVFDADVAVARLAFT